MPAKNLKLEISSEFTNTDVVLCPLCHFEYNHIKAGKRVEGQDNYKAGWWGRGDLVVIKMLCEEGHKWELCLGFHKGNTYIFARAEANAA